MTRPILPFTLVPGPDRRVTRDGHPVWTCADDDDHARLAEAAVRLDAALVEVDAVPADAGDDDHAEVVAALGADCEPAARLYAHLTARSAVVVDDVAALRSIAGLAVVVTTHDRVDVPLLVELSAPERDALVGLCCAADVTRLRRQLLVRAAWAQVPPPIGLDAIYSLAPELPIGVKALGPVTHLGGAAAATDVADALAAGSALVVVTTHSDGIDAKLGDGVLCSQPPERRFTGPGAPFCQVHGRCYRLDRPLAEAWATGRLVAAATVRTRVLVLNVCNGLLVASAAVDPRHGLVASLLDNPSVGAVVTTWDIGHQSQERHDAMIELLAAGAPCGAASADYQRLPSLAAWGERIVVLGDPRVRVVAPLDDELDTDDPDDAGDLGLLIALLEPIAAAPSGQARDAAVAALALAQARQAGARDAATLAALQRAVFDVYTIQSTWVSLAWRRLDLREIDVDPRAVCPHCERPARRFGHELTALRLRRDTIVCATCRMASDAPAGAPLLGLDVSRPGQVGLRGAAPAGAAVHLVLRPPAQALNAGAAWPLDAATGRPVDAFAPPLRWPTGPLEVSVLMMVGARLSIFQRQLWCAGEVAA